ncbi:MAG: HPr family phosphocarrier protein [Clostridiales bacterium]|nr:HPr family phosphocarrier protein [Clostridia bacterium]MCR5566104.1 HPr family phosphocarrier protein [Clostridiales bacterium]
MKCVNIRLSVNRDLNQFVSIVNRFPYEMNLWCGRHVRDAKSVLGILSLDLDRPLTLMIHHDNCEQLLEELSPFIE